MPTDDTIARIKAIADDPRGDPKIRVVARLAPELARNPESD